MCVAWLQKVYILLDASRKWMCVSVIKQDTWLILWHRKSKSKSWMSTLQEQSSESWPKKFKVHLKPRLAAGPDGDNFATGNQSIKRELQPAYSNDSPLPALKIQWTIKQRNQSTTAQGWGWIKEWDVRKCSVWKLWMYKSWGHSNQTRGWIEKQEVCK